MESENLLFEIQKAKAKLYSFLEIILNDPTKHIKNLTQYKQVKKLIKKLNEPSLNRKWQEINENYKFYNYLYSKQYERKSRSKVECQK